MSRSRFMLVLIAAVSLLAISALLVVFLTSSRRTLAGRASIGTREESAPRLAAVGAEDGYATVRNTEAGVSVTLPVVWGLDEDSSGYLIRALYAGEGATVFFEIRSEENLAGLSLEEFARASRPFEIFSSGSLGARVALVLRARAAYDADSRGRPIPISESARVVYLASRGSSVIEVSCSALGARYAEHASACERAAQSVAIEE